MPYDRDGWRPMTRSETLEKEEMQKRSDKLYDQQKAESERLTNLLDSEDF